MATVLFWSGCNPRISRKLKKQTQKPDTSQVSPCSGHDQEQLVYRPVRPEGMDDPGLMKPLVTLVSAGGQFDSYLYLDPTESLKYAVFFFFKKIDTISE